jgi:hypothetical protein
LRKQELNDIAKEKKEEKENDKPAKEKKKRRQVSGKRKGAIEDRLLDLIPEQTKPLIDGWFAGMPPILSHLKLKLALRARIYCYRRSLYLNMFSCCMI